MTASKSLRALREAIVLEHLEAENEREFEVAVGAFDHARWEVMATGEVIEGRAAVVGYYERVVAAGPELRSHVVSLHHAEGAVIVELRHDGDGVLGRSGVFFLFDGARLVGKRVYGGWYEKSRHPVAGMAAPLSSDGNRT
ncbi:nuclear transport factor 2 family protein [Saccharothrix sp.]|uniref:nuclear transport factor 2 family protein n=1 Tax=Saccharothrix sp. TaxID=1873460 RepID=UPI0028126CFF|nr:nuclear transport factor 2 family protein [Saccharothrix sp.]